MKPAAVAAGASLLVIAIQAHPAEPLGRFFFTPAQRAQLDTARSQNSRATLASEQTETAPVPEVVTYGGMVRRSDGKSTVWINNRPVNDRTTEGIAIERVRPDGAVTLKVPQANRDVQLKVGQSVDIVSGTIEEPFARRPATPAPATGKPGTGENGGRSAPEGAAGGHKPEPVPAQPVAGDVSGREAGSVAPGN